MHPTKRAELEYYAARARWGENNAVTQRTYQKWQELILERRKRFVKKEIDRLIENPKEWWERANDSFGGRMPKVVLEKEVELLERMIYSLKSGEIN